MTKYKKLTVEVTQEHIDEGIPNDCDSCAVSLAFSDALVKVYGNQCLVKTSMSDGEVELRYSIDNLAIAGNSVFEAVNLDNETVNLQYKIDAFVNEYDNSFLSSHGHNTMPLADFTPRYCVPFTFDVEIGGLNG